MPKTLLLADDSITIQKVVGITFANEDFEIVSVDNGESAFNKAKEIKPDIVLADVVMPKLDGYQVCEKIKTDPGLQHIPVLLLTGAFKPFDEEKSKRVGANGHIAKPFDSQALIDKVNQLVAQSGGSAVPPTPQPLSPPQGVAPVMAPPVPMPAAAPPPVAPMAAPPIAAPPIAAPAVTPPVASAIPPAMPLTPPAPAPLPPPTASSDPFATPSESQLTPMPPVAPETGAEISLGESMDLSSAPPTPGDSLGNAVPDPSGGVPQPMEMSMFEGLPQTPVASPGAPPPAAPAAPSPFAPPLAANPEPTPMTPTPPPQPPANVPENIWAAPVAGSPQPPPPFGQPAILPVADPIPPMKPPVAPAIPPPPQATAPPPPPSPTPEVIAPPPAPAFTPPPIPGAPGLSGEIEVEMEPPKRAQAPTPPPSSIDTASPGQDLGHLPREVIEKIAWEIIPDLAETIIREEIDRLKREKGILK